MRYQVCIEFDPPASAPRQAQASSVEPEDSGRLSPVRAWVASQPGCFCEARNEVDALARLPAVIAEHIGWLRRHGEEVLDDGLYELDVIERVEAPPGRSEPAFSVDQIPADKNDIEQAIRRMEYARSDLLSTIETLPEAAAAWRPAPERWNVHGIVAHIASADCYYRTSLLAEEPEREPEHERHDLRLQRERAVSALVELTADECQAVYHPTWAWRGNGREEWTVRKALRRFIYHERFHTRDIEQTMAWLVAGGP